MRLIVVIALLSLGLAGPVRSQDNQASGVEQVQFTEKVKPSAEISGAVVLGLVSGGAEVQSAPSLSAWLPASWGGKHACVRLRSIDGLYEGDLDMVVAPNWPGGISTIPIKKWTKHSQRLKGLPPGSMAAYVRPGACDHETSPRNPGTVAYWNVNPPGAGPLLLLVNSFHADEVFVARSSAGPEKPVKCGPAPGAMLAAYDTICQIAREWLKPGGTELLIYRMRRQAFDPAVPVKFIGEAQQ